MPMQILQRLGSVLGKAAENWRARVGVAITFGVVVGLLTSLMDWYTASLSQVAKYLIRWVLASGFAAFICWLVLEAAYERKQRVSRELERAARLNHDIRNALDVINSAGYLINDKIHGPAVVASVNRIDRVLKQEYPGPERRRKTGET